MEDGNNIVGRQGYQPAGVTIFHGLIQSLPYGGDRGLIRLSAQVRKATHDEPPGEANRPRVTVYRKDTTVERV